MALRKVTLSENQVNALLLVEKDYALDTGMYTQHMGYPKGFSSKLGSGLRSLERKGLVKGMREEIYSASGTHMIEVTRWYITTQGKKAVSQIKSKGFVR